MRSGVSSIVKFVPAVRRASAHSVAAGLGPPGDGLDADGAVDAATCDAAEPGGALDELFARYQLSLVRLAINLVDDRVTAEDVVQDVFVALQRSGRLERIEDPHRYLTSAVVNRSRSVLRRRRVLRRHARDAPLPAVPMPDDLAVARAEHDRVLAAIRRLPARQRAVVVLRYLEETPVADIADILGISPGAVSSSLHRALITLRVKLGDPHGT